MKIIDSIKSNTNLLKYGVPLCSELGLISFIFCENTVYDLNINGKLVTFTYDTCQLFRIIHGKKTTLKLKTTNGLNLTYKCMSEIGWITNFD